MLEADLGTTCSRADFFTELGRPFGRRGGLTGSKAGLSGSLSIVSGLGVEGVECVAHLVPRPLVKEEDPVDSAGVRGIAIFPFHFLPGTGVVMPCPRTWSGMGGT